MGMGLQDCSHSAQEDFWVLEDSELGMFLLKLLSRHIHLCQYITGRLEMKDIHLQLLVQESARSLLSFFN